MDYEFHVGDYVETIDGEIGYLTKIVIDEDFINFYGVCTKSNIFKINLSINIRSTRIISASI